jgi:hypothetical protein
VVRQEFQRSVERGWIRRMTKRPEGHRPGRTQVQIRLSTEKLVRSPNEGSATEHTEGHESKLPGEPCRGLGGTRAAAC